LEWLAFQEPRLKSNLNKKERRRLMLFLEREK